jgi:phage shock protein PspC (stress-responsive transcriptional regulator)
MHSWNLPIKELTSCLQNNIALKTIIKWFEQQAFGVCSWWGEKLGIKATKIRMYFIYLSFFTVGSPIILYFIMAFLLEQKDRFIPRKIRRKNIWEF